MKIFKLEPNPSGIDDPDWKLSTHKGPVIIRAENEKQAFELAGGSFWKPTSLVRGETSKTNPWNRDIGLVDCREIDNEKYSKDGEAAILEPKHY